MRYLFFFGCLLALNVTYATEGIQNINTQPLMERYRSLSSECEVINGFRMMKLYRMDPLWQSVQDSLNRAKAEQYQLRSIIDSQRTEISHLKTSLHKIESEKQGLSEAVSSMSVMGKQITKASFITSSGLLVLGLTVLVIVIFMMYRVTFVNARELRISNETLTKEFEEHKHQAIEKQIKLSRELQNYRNRLAELKAF